ncbi:uncharacterized protein LOC114286804 [Camellia sinensis]|uniref:uncharacterized protein LOC114286804 n=1 Tax=Camellia sinensis TaxID=4442 RepID=UPI001035ACC3|nr:uncharacterized protein LOC114286804 [Camellia sinensis]
MPPSPAMRCSPIREIKGDNHKKGRSLEGRILLREKNDNHALFNEMKTRERDSFLLQSNDDFEHTFSMKLRYLSDYKLGMNQKTKRKTRKSSGFSRGVSKYRGVAREQKQHHHNGRWETRIGRVFGNKYLYLGTYGNDFALLGKALIFLFYKWLHVKDQQVPCVE